MSGQPGLVGLQGLRVADLSNSVAGQFAARLFADNGAAVTLYEPAAGSPVRRLPPFSSSSDPDDDRRSLLFWHLNGGKSSRVAEGRPVDALMSDTRETAIDIVITDQRAVAGEVVAAGSAVLTGLVTDFAASGPYASWLGGELVHQALSGSMHYNGRADREPLYGAGHRASIAAGLHLYIRLASEILGRLRGTPTDTYLEVAIHEAAAAMEQNFSTQWAYSATIPARGEWNRPKGRLRCRDGWMVFFGMGHRREELFEAFGAASHSDSELFRDWPSFIANIADVCDTLAPYAAERTQSELTTAALEHKLVLSPVRTLTDLGSDEQLLARDFWIRVSEAGRSRERLVLGAMWRPDGSPQVRDRPAPSPSQTASAPTAPPWLPARGAVASAAARPLTGLRIVDLTSAWAGPMATRIFAALGAEVIKVEGPERMDGWRGPRRDPSHLPSYPACDPGDRPYNRNAWFNTQNLDKKSIAVDLRAARGLELAYELIADSDAVIANFSPGTMDGLGLDYDSLRRINPRVVVVEMPGFGNSGPLREHRGLGQTMEALSGITSLIGYPDDGKPLGSGSAYLDPMGGLTGAAALVTGLISQLRSSEAQYIEVPQREAAIHWIGELVLDALENGREHAPRGNAVDEAFPHDAFRTRDGWVAISVFDARQWTGLCRVFGWGAWAEAPSLVTVDQRRRGGDRIIRALNEATSTWLKADLAKCLQANGVPSAPVNDGRDLYGDPQLRHRGWFTSLDHPEAGCHDYPGVPVVIGDELARPTKAAPTLGQHTREVLVDILGLPSEEVDALAASGTVLCDERHGNLPTGVGGSRAT